MDYSQFKPNTGGDYGLTSYDGNTMLRYVPKENYQISIYKTKGIGQKPGTFQQFNTIPVNILRKLNTREET